MTGTVEVRCDGTRRTLRSGDSFTFPPEAARMWRNVGDGDAHIVAEFRPAGRIEHFQEAFFGLMQERSVGKGWAQYLPLLLRAAVILDEYRSEIYPARPPLVVQRAVLGLLAAIGRLKGYRAGPSDHGGKRVVGGVVSPGHERLL